MLNVLGCIDLVLDLLLLLSGKGNKEIAEALDISKRTAEVHRFNLMKKLKVKNKPRLLEILLVPQLLLSMTSLKNLI